MNWNILGLTAALLTLNCVAFADAPSLLESATKVCDASRWTCNDGSSESYLWLSERKVLSWQGDRKQPKEMRRVRFKAFLLDLDSGKEEPLTAFNARFIRRLDFPKGMLLSPDGKWILGLDVKLVGPPETWFAIALDGSRIIEGPLYDRGQGVNGNPSSLIGVWTSNSLDWITMVNVVRPKIIHYHLQKPSDFQEFRVPGLESISALNDAFYPRFLGVTSTGRGFIAASQFAERTDMLCCDIGFDEKALPPHFFTIQVPKNARVDAVHLSPKGDRLAWFFQFFQALPPDSKETGEARVELWVSHLDGSDMHPVGSHPVGNTDTLYTAEYPDQLRWVPGGKRLSFLYKNGLYTIPAE